MPAPATWQHEQDGPTETVEALFRVAIRYAEDQALDLSPSKISKLVRTHIRTSGSLAAATATLAYMLSYADPTGETAVYNAARYPERRKVVEPAVTAPIATPWRLMGDAPQGTCNLHVVSGCADCAEIAQKKNAPPMGWNPAGQATEPNTHERHR